MTRVEERRQTGLPPVWPVSTVRAREHAHRRDVLVGIAVLIVMSMTPLFGHHVLTPASAWFGGGDHVVGLCLVVLREMLAPVHFGFHLLLVVGLCYAVFDRLRALRNSLVVLRAVGGHVPSAGSPVGRAAAAVGLDRRRIRVTPTLANPAFTAGWLVPRVYVAAELAELLTEAQLAAVLAHEAAHVCRRDPLRLSLLRFLACTLFYLPALRRLAEDAADEAEVIADDAAALGRPWVLAEAIILVATLSASGRRGVTPAPRAFGQTVGFHRPGLIDRRVRRLVGEEVSIRTHVTRRSLAAAAAVLIAVSASGLVMASPVFAHQANLARSGAPASTPQHCRHAGLAFTHLFCLEWGGRSSGAPCPYLGG